MLCTLRRVKQLTYLLFNPSFRDSDAIRDQSCARYASAEEIAYYRDVAFHGFYEDERAMVDEFMLRHGRGRALVIGCGGGREALALKGLGFQVVGIDRVPAMIEAARERALEARLELEFRAVDVSDLPDEQHYDLIFVSIAIAEHIRGREARRQFYREISRRLATGGAVFVSPAIRKFAPNSLYFWASMILRLRWRLGNLDWENGDTVKSFFGSHNSDFRPVFYHFYPDAAAFQEEIGAAGLRVDVERDGAFFLRAGAR